MKFILAPLVLLMAINFHLLAISYQQPDDRIVKIVEAGDPPHLVINRARTFALELHYSSTPSIAYLSQPMVKLAGVEFFPQNSSAVHTVQLQTFKIVALKGKNQRKKISLSQSHQAPLDSPKFNPQGNKLAYSVLKPNCAELWVASSHSGKTQQVKNICLNSILEDSYSWIDDSRLLIKERLAFNPGNGNGIPEGPVVLETTGAEAKNRTYQNLLKNKQDEFVFENFIRSQLTIVNTANFKSHHLLKPSLIQSYSLSPDSNYLLIKKIQKPFSYIVPMSRFATSLEVYDLKGRFIKKIAERPVQENIPIGGVAQGIRQVDWVSSLPSSLSLIQALDGGDWKNKVPHRDLITFAEIRDNRYLMLETRFKTKHRFSSIDWFEDGRRAFIWDFERDKKRISADLVDAYSGKILKRVWEFGVDDIYHHPGRVVETLNGFNRKSIRPIIRNNQEWLHLAGEGASPEGERPFLRLLSLESGKSEELFLSETKRHQEFLLFLDEEFNRYLTLEQSPTVPPHIIERSIDNPSMKKLFWDYQEPAEIFSKIKSELLTYKRRDGVSLSGMLYYPADYQAGKRYPVIIAAYPRQYSSAEEAGQVRESVNKYVRPFRADVKYFALKGYALLDRAQMPIVGDPENMNDTFLSQIAMNAQAAIDAVEQKGILDGKRVAVIGHSYGAFMVANLLTHTDLFKTGIARSGAYNRTLTPNGFQNERRTFWEASDTYMKTSPFASADQINKPILLIHGEDDANAGTFPMQSERYFSALQSNGKVARLVLLPKEGHGYASKESILHLLWEQFSWLERHL